MITNADIGMFVGMIAGIWIMCVVGIIVIGAFPIAGIIACEMGAMILGGTLGHLVGRKLDK